MTSLVMPKPEGDATQRTPGISSVTRITPQDAPKRSRRVAAGAAALGACMAGTEKRLSTEPGSAGQWQGRRCREARLNVRSRPEAVFREQSDPHWIAAFERYGSG